MWDRGAASLLGRSKAEERAEPDRADVLRENKPMQKKQWMGKTQTENKSEFLRNLFNYGASVNTEDNCGGARGNKTHMTWCSWEPRGRHSLWQLAHPIPRSTERMASVK